jgi:hypothetical protein
VPCKNSNDGTADLRDTTGLLPDIDQTRRIFLFLDAMHIFQSQAFIPHDTVIGTAMEQRMVNA